jgi:hypothetical protein
LPLSLTAYRPAPEWRWCPKAHTSTLAQTPPMRSPKCLSFPEKASDFAFDPY